MLNPAHMLEIALLLLVAFLIGAVVGSLARLVVARLVPAKAAAPAPVVVAEPPKPEEMPALVAAPVIGEVVKTPMPAAPAEVTAPDFTEVLLALAGDKPGNPASKIRMPSIAPLPVVAVTKPAAEMQPARVAGETTSGRVVAHPRSAAEPVRAVAPGGAGAEVIPFPLEKLPVEISEPAVVVAAAPMPAVELPPPALAEPSTPEPETEVTVEFEVAAELEVAPFVTEVLPSAVTGAEATMTIGGPDDQTESLASLAPAEVFVAEPPTTVAEVTRIAAPLPEPVAAAAAPAAAPDHTAEDDETAAMRAIEGNWSPRRATSQRPRKVDLPEVSAEAAVMASATAVASATEAANEAITPEPEAPGRPIDIPAPRLGVKDDLTHVIGILPIIETALNNLGLYHFDQVAELTDENTGWIENHLGIAGRIGREHWREQARELALAMAGTKKAAGQH